MKQLIIIFLSENNPLTQLEFFRANCKNVKADRFIFYNGVKLETLQDIEKIFKPLGSDKTEKIMNAFLKGFLKDYTSILFLEPFSVLDCFTIEKAFSYLKFKETVIGPCSDGSLYLLGISNFKSEIFEGDLVHQTVVSSLSGKKEAFVELPMLQLK